MKLATTIAAVLAAAVAGAGAQPPRPDQGAPPPGAARETDPAAMRARLERWLEETRHREETIQAALKRLDEGASPEDVQRGMVAGIRPNRQGERSGGVPRDGATARARHDGQGPHDGPSGPADPHARPGADADQVLIFIEKHNPELAGRLATMRRDNPDSADRIIGRLAPHIREVLAERDDQTRELRIDQLKNGWEVMGAAGRLRDAVKAGDSAAREQGVARLRELFGQGFDLRVRLHEREIVVLEQRLAKLRQELSDQRNDRETFITDQLRRATEPRERREPKPDGKPDSKPEPKP